MVYLLFAFLIMVLSFFCCTYNKYFNQVQRKIMWFCFILIIAFLCSMIDPRINYDLARYYIDLDIIRGSHVELGEFVLGDIIITDDNYRFTYTHNFISYVISHYFPKQALPFFTISFCYGCMAYIFEDIHENEKVYNWKIAMVILIAITTLPLVYVYSNIRTAMAMSIMGLNIYRIIYKNENILCFIVMSLIAATIHPVALAIIPFLFLSRLRLPKIGILFISIVPFIVNYVMEIFQYSDNLYLKYIGIKYYNYVFVEIYSQGIFFYYSELLMTIAVLCIILFVDYKEKKENIKHIKMKNIITWYCVFILSCAQSYQLILRLPFLFGVLSPIILKNIVLLHEFGHWKRNLNIYIVLAIISLSLVAIAQNFRWLI